MGFATPWAFLLLLPWAAAALWTLLAAREPEYVPFTPLWPKETPQESKRRSLQLPPVWVMLLLAVALLVIVAATGPALRGNGRRLTIVIDCGLTMSPKGRVQSALDRLHFSPADQLHVIPVPGEAFEAVGSIDVARLQFTAASNESALDRSVRAALATNDTPVIVVTDHSPPLTQDARLVVAAPSQPLRDAGIERFLVKDVGDGRLQAMVRVFNRTDVKKATLAVTGSDSQAIDLPPAGSRRDYFFDLHAGVPACTASLDVNDDIRADNEAFLVSTPMQGPIHLPADASQALQRMTAVYTRRHPAAADREPVVVSFVDPHPENTAVWLAGGANGGMADASKLVVALDVLTQNVNWPAIAAEVAGRPMPEGAGWTVLVSSGDAALLAKRESPQRQVWVGFDIDAFSRWQDYVVFWTNVFDWLNPTDLEYRGELAGQQATPLRMGYAPRELIDALGLSWTVDGQPVAVSAAVPTGDLVTGTGVVPIPASNSLGLGNRPLTAWVGLGAILLLGVSLETRRRGNAV